ncbi:MAG: ABC transporter permease [Gammaproteobacteria bacterium]|nr:ABC transporter permease [Gammaproteobacteria bacterium]
MSAGRSRRAREAAGSQPAQVPAPRAPWSAATALLGVALGVASVVAVHLISARVEHSLDQSLPLHLAGLTHMAEREGLSADDYFDLRAWWRGQGGTDIEAMVPVVEGHTLLDGRRVLVVGADWLAMPRAGTGANAVTVTGEFLSGEEVVADARLGVAAGESLTVAGRDYRIADVGETGLGPALFVDIAVAHRMLGLDADALSRVGLAGADPWQRWRRWLDRLMPGFSAGLPQRPSPALPGPAPADAGLQDAWRVLPVAAERPTAELARSVLFNLGALGGLALLVAWFLIYQVGVIWLRRQQLLFERLQVLGVGPGRLRRGFLTLFAALGLLATIVGVVLGALLAPLLVGLSAQGVDVNSGTPSGLAALDVWVLGKAAASGLGVCLLAGQGAFARAWRPREPSPWRRRLVIPALAAVALLGIGLDGSGVVGGFAAILAMSLLGVALVLPALALLRRAADRLRGRLTVRLALRDVAWYPRVLNVALAALTLAVATSIGIGVMVESFRLDFQRMLDIRLAGDLYVDRSGGNFDALDAWLAGQPDAARVVRFGEERIRIEGRPVELGYGRFDAAQSARYGYAGALQPGEALISENLARELDAGPGAALRAGPARLTVVGTFPGFGEAMGRVLVDEATLPRLNLPPRFDRLTVELAPGSRLADRLTAEFPDARVESRSDVRALALRIFDRTFAITQALTLLALTVAVVGTYNALTALRLQQAPTARLLAAQGMSDGQLRRIGVLRAGTLGGIAVVLALPLGLAMAWVLCTVINPRSFGWTVSLHLPAAGWLPPLLLGMGAAVLAGALPAPREQGVLHDAG